MQHHRRGCNNIPSFLQRTAPIARSLCEGLNLARPPHPGHSTILLRSEIPSGMSAKLRTVAASNNSVHMPLSLYYCLFTPHICMVLFFTHILFVVNHTFNSTPPERLQQRVHSVHIFLLHKSNTDEMQTPKQFTDNYCIRSPYRSIE